MTHVQPLTDAEVECLDPGVREIVVLLRLAGFETTDSGDGVSKPPAERVFEYPHVYAVVPADKLLEEADRLFILIGPEWNVEGVYLPTSGTALLAATKCEPAKLWAALHIKRAETSGYDPFA